MWRLLGGGVGSCGSNQSHDAASVRSRDAVILGARVCVNICRHRSICSSMLLNDH